MGNIDEDRQRFTFQCKFKDLVKDTTGQINALIIFNAKKEAYFESLTVKFIEPREHEFKITESTEDLAETEHIDVKRFNRPKTVVQ